MPRWVLSPEIDRMNSLMPRRGGKGGLKAKEERTSIRGPPCGVFLSRGKGWNGRETLSEKWGGVEVIN